MRSTSVLASLLSLLLIFLLIRRDFGYGIAMLVLAAFTFNADFWVYGRSGLLEPMVMLGMLATTWALRNGYESAEDNPSGITPFFWFAAVAALAMATLLAKVISVYFLISVTVVVCVWPPKRKAVLFALFGVFAALLLLYLGPFMQINAPYFERESSYWADRAGSSDHLRLWLTQPIFYTMRHTSVLTQLGAVAIIWAFFGLRDKTERRRRVVTAVMALTFILGSQFLSVVSYRPQRYYVPLFVPVSILSACTINHLFGLCRDRIEVPRINAAKIIAALAVLTFVLTLSPLAPIRLLDRHVDAFAFSPRERMTATMALVTTILLLGIAGRKLIVAWINKIPGVVRTGGLTLCLLLAFAQYARLNSHPYRHWPEHPRYGMRDFGSMLGDRYRDMHIAGTTPLFSVIDNTHHAYKVTDYNLNWSVMTNGTVTHAIIPTQFGMLPFFERTFSNTMTRATEVERVTIGPHPHVLYAFDLEPLKTHITDSETGAPTLTLTNPDSHTPQSRTLAFGGPNVPAGLVESYELDLLPMDSETRSFSSSHQLSSALLIPRNAWYEGSKGWVEAKRIEEVTDPLAWEVDAIALTPSTKGDRTSIFALKNPSNETPSLVGVRLRGCLGPDDHVTVEWCNGGTAQVTTTVPHAALSDKAYTPVVLATGESPEQGGVLRIRYVGSGTLHADAMLFLTKQQASEYVLGKRESAAPERAARP